MLTKSKLSALSSSALFKSPFDVIAKAQPLFISTLTGLKKPYVAPILAMGVFIAGGVLFLNLASDPSAGSPSVWINLAKVETPKAAVAPSQNPDDAPSGLQAFTLDSLGLFKDADTNQFNANGEAIGQAPIGADAGPIDGTAVITLPEEEGNKGISAVTKLAPRPLLPAPFAGLSQTSPTGPLPIIAPDGRTPSKEYTRPFSPNGKPMVALIVGGLGLNPTTTRAAIEQLPAEVTLSFVPYAEGLQGWIDMARAQGHEVMIEVPMQPVNYPDNDPGPQTLLVNQRTEDMTTRLNWILSRASGYFGVTNYQGSAFLRDKDSSKAFLDVLKARGLSFIDDGQARGLNGAWARASADRIIDAQINAQSITAQLAGLETSAKSKGQALGTGFAYPVTLAVAIKWTKGLEQKGLQLAPASAIKSK
jgi:uncharacterized protein